jgi:PAS domain S-box-containing protein
MQVYAAAEELLTLVDVLALSTDPMFAIDERHRIVFWNRPIQRLLGYEYDDVAGRTCAKVLGGVDAFGNRYCGEACPIVTMARCNDPVRQFRLAIRAKDGQAVPLDVVVVKFVLPQTRRVVLAHIVRPAEVAAETPPPRARLAKSHDLTDREVEVLSLFASGERTERIADRLCISRITTRNHIQHIFRKLEVHSRAEAVAYAYRSGMV